MLTNSALRRPRATAATAIGIAALGGAIALALAGCGLVGPAVVDTSGKVEFDRPLAIPPLAPSTLDADGTRVFALTAERGETEFEPGVPSETWGYDDDHLGPTLVAERGERVRVDVQNDLDEATTLHWHGMQLPAAVDGGPHQPIEPGASRHPEWTIDQPAATLWYHPHPHEETEQQVERGLAGLFLLHDPAERALGLPSAYGVDDVPLIVQDVSFDDDGRRTGRATSFAGALGDETIVNGTRSPYFEATTELVRLRLLNASTARILGFELADGRPMQQIASDGGLLAAPVETAHVRLSPGERAEVVVRLTPGERVVLRSRMTSAELGGDDVLAGLNGGRDVFDVLELRAAADLTASAPVPAALADLPDLPGPDEVAIERRFDLHGFDINDRSMDPDRIDLVAERGRTERWIVHNTSKLPHSFHVHDAQFRIESIGGAPPPPELAGWKDTVYAVPETEIALLVRFDGPGDPEHPYMYHCHLLMHEDAGMMGQFLVVEPGQDADEHFRMDDGEGHRHG
ncbi:multicopper oxidase family protein [Agromyces seonyuensis]|uniref:Multicopper oxidase domain-containing protein n=1 Tax=Agromyces seonyuensis TaxID=2662446 RepID=A0A6I4P2D7_9MICO|nr:multicopper oxidase domain-containing protein [Agromyces seonyuensis]MWB97354.1 multicopper oxidase domain-containing protein [Agromyces seonyuensis]